MVSSRWAKLNPSIKFRPTKKQYFNRYLWRLVYKIDRVYVASEKRYAPNVIDYINTQRAVENMRAHEILLAQCRGPWVHRSLWGGVNETLVARVRQVMETYKDRVKFRTEGDSLQIYAETEQDLVEVSVAINYDIGMELLCSPISGTEEALRNGHVFMKKINHKYKIVLRDGVYDVGIKRSILAQLTQREDVKIPENLRRELLKSYPALWGAYFYSNDESIVTMLSLISPGIVGKIHTIDHLG